MSFGRILLGLLALLLVLGFFGYRWAAKIEPTAMTAADLDKGGDFSAEEKSAFTASCTTRIKKDAEPAAVLPTRPRPNSHASSVLP